MSIVLKENEWAENAVGSKSLGKKPSETLRRVARYYFDKGYNTDKVRKYLEIFLLQCDPVASVTKWDSALSSAIRLASKYRAIDIDGIDITKPEMMKIDALEGIQTKRLAFTLLCLSKFWNIVSESDGWVNNKDNEIMFMANINTSIKRQSMMFGKLNELGYIQFSKKIDNTNVKVCFNESGETALTITDFRNLGYQYLMYHGAPYFECKNCGITTKLNDPKNHKYQKYCASCAAEIHLQKRINSVMKRQH